MSNPLLCVWRRRRRISSFFPLPLFRVMQWEAPFLDKIPNIAGGETLQRSPNKSRRAISLAAERTFTRRSRSDSRSFNSFPTVEQIGMPAGCVLIRSSHSSSTSTAREPSHVVAFTFVHPILPPRVHHVNLFMM
ncbi:hypothetical protein AVEN_256684-1 [Araneus ventricosus]|uniref:Uncharacterized protein n=1 Tax=Araneus ventricosus TaxID=182803 RepID=A0A4Y2EJ26_ARAVE|nr:hypothetical protein AVEN_256684-1 [Araneus ventricosus]